MIPRLKGDIIHDHDTKLPQEDGEDMAIGWGTRPNPKAKPFRDDPGETLTRSWGNRPNPEKDLASTNNWGNRPNPRKNPAGIKVQGQHNNRLGNGGKVRSTLIPPKTKPTHGASR